VLGFEGADEGCRACSRQGESRHRFVILSIGVRLSQRLPKRQGLSLSVNKAIGVDAHMANQSADIIRSRRTVPTAILS